MRRVADLHLHSTRWTGPGREPLELIDEIESELGSPAGRELPIGSGIVFAECGTIAGSRDVILFNGEPSAAGSRRAHPGRRAAPKLAELVEPELLALARSTKLEFARWRGAELGSGAGHCRAS